MSPAIILAITVVEGLHPVANAITTIRLMKIFRLSLNLRMDQRVLPVMPLMVQGSMVIHFLRNITIAAIQVAIESVAAASNPKALYMQIPVRHHYRCRAICFLIPGVVCRQFSQDTLFT